MVLPGDIVEVNGGAGARGRAHAGQHPAVRPPALTSTHSRIVLIKAMGCQKVIFKAIFRKRGIFFF